MFLSQVTANNKSYVQLKGRFHVILLQEFLHTSFQISVEICPGNSQERTVKEEKWFFSINFGLQKKANKIRPKKNTIKPYTSAQTRQENKNKAIPHCSDSYFIQFLFCNPAESCLLGS